MRNGRFTLVVPVLAAIGILAIGQPRPHAASQSSPLWFDVPLPAGLGDPHHPVLDVSSAKPAPATVPPGEERFQDLAGPAIRAHLGAIVGISRADRARGERAWGRITGFRAADETHAWVRQQFIAAGLREVATQTYVATQDTWYPRSWEVRLLAGPQSGAGSRDVVLESAFPTTGSQLPERTLTAPVVFVGATTDPVLPSVDVKGKVAVQTLHPQGGAFSERTRTTQRARDLAGRGAVAVLNIVEQAGNMHVRDFSNCGVPCFNLGTDDGRFLSTTMERAGGQERELKIAVSLQAERLRGLQGRTSPGEACSVLVSP